MVGMRSGCDRTALRQAAMRAAFNAGPVGIVAGSRSTKAEGGILEHRGACCVEIYPWQ